MSDYPDWMRVTGLVGVDSEGNPILIRVDDDGHLEIPLKGAKGDGSLKTVAVDDDGQLYAIMKGQGNNIILVDDDGYMSAILKGERADDSLHNIAIDNDDQLITIMKGRDGNIVAVDGDGALAAALKGLYGEELVTLGVDENGYIAAYLLDSESQWGHVIKTGTAELAARLGSPVTYDWRGKVVQLLDFGHGTGGLKKTTSGDGAAVALDPFTFNSGGYSVKLTGGKDVSKTAWLSGGVDIPPTDRIGVSIRFSSDVAFDFLNLQLEIYDGVKYSQGYVRWDRDNNKLQYWNSGQAWADLVDQKFYLAESAWHHLKLVIDKSTYKYVRALSGGIEHDMSALAMYQVGNASDQNLLWSVCLYSHTGSNNYVWLDNIIVTVGEPSNE